MRNNKCAMHYVRLAVACKTPSHTQSTVFYWLNEVNKSWVLLHKTRFCPKLHVELKQNYQYLITKLSTKISNITIYKLRRPQSIQLLFCTFKSINYSRFLIILYLRVNNLRRIREDTYRKTVVCDFPVLKPRARLPQRVIWSIWNLLNNWKYRQSFFFKCKKEIKTKKK